MNREDAERLVRIEEMVKTLVDSNQDKEARLRRIEDKTTTAKGALVLIWPIFTAMIAYYIKNISK